MLQLKSLWDRVANGLSETDVLPQTGFFLSDGRVRMNDAGFLHITMPKFLISETFSAKHITATSFAPSTHSNEQHAHPSLFWPLVGADIKFNFGNLAER